MFLTFAGFILAFFALIKRIHQFRIKAGIFTMNHIFWILIFLGFIALIQLSLNSFPQFRIELVQIYSHLNNLAKILIIICNALMVAIVIYLFNKFMKPIKFTKKNDHIYLNECYRIIASGIETDIQQLATEMYHSVKPIFNYAFEKNSEKTNGHAIELMDLFSDELFCKAIVNHNPLTLYEIFGTIIRNCKTHKIIGKNFINRLLVLMITEPNSQLRREEPFHGLGKLKTFKNLIFGDIEFLLSQYQPLSCITELNNKLVDSKAVEKYFEMFIFSFETYLNDGDKNPDIIYSALNNIAQMISIYCSALNRSTEKELPYSSHDKNISAYCTGVFIFIASIIRNENKFPSESNVLNDDYDYFKNDHNIFGAIAHGIYDIIESFSIKPCQFESARLILINLYLSHRHNSAILIAIQNRLDIYLRKTITNNLKEVNLIPVTACLIYTFGLREPNKATIPIHKALLVELKKNYLGMYQSNTDIALDMLPGDTEIDISRNKLVRKEPYRWRRNKAIEELILDEQQQ